MPTLGQQRAMDALKNINALAQQGVSNYGHYRSYVSSLPASILTSGLGQAMAQLLAQSKGGGGASDPHKLLYDHLEGWLCSTRNLFGNEANLIRGIVNGDQQTYVRAQVEALAYLTWLKKFARAYLDKP